MKAAKEIIQSSRPVVRGESVVYALILKDEIVYIGQSREYIRRLGNHLHDGDKKFDRFAIIENLGDWSSTAELNRVEKKYIRKFKPRYNKTCNPNYTPTKKEITTFGYKRRVYKKLENRRRYSNIVSREKNSTK